MAITVCKDCDKRHLGCHDECRDYQDSKVKHDATNYEIQAYMNDKHWKLKKRYG